MGTMQNCVFAGGAAIPLAGGAYWYKNYRDRKKAEATVAGKIKSKVGQNGFYAVCAVGVTAVGGFLLSSFIPEAYSHIIAKLPDWFSFLRLKDHDEHVGKKPDANGTGTNNDACSNLPQEETEEAKKEREFKEFCAKLKKKFKARFKKDMTEETLKWVDDTYGSKIPLDEINGYRAVFGLPPYKGYSSSE